MQLELYRITKPSYAGKFMVYCRYSNCCTAINYLDELPAAYERIEAQFSHYFIPSEEGAYLCTFDSSQIPTFASIFPELSI